MEAAHDFSDAVFSTSVEVFLHLGLPQSLVHRLLHVRGGVSSLKQGASTSLLSSPRPWRCFFVVPVTVKRANVFSTSVEVFLRKVIGL